MRVSNYRKKKRYVSEEQKEVERLRAEGARVREKMEKQQTAVISQMLQKWR